ncbi:MAG TPA: (d)CMP kinase [Phycisphaerae bacterium]|nr:(d)CMP kinase [Phycisphaerae bacterium]HPS52621.1 (d)CMP kinase [Phycisphaerae bacterium]
MIVTIDGPAGSGKSTAARKLAQRLGISFLDSGAMYRAVTLKAIRSGTDLRDDFALAREAENIDLKMSPDGDNLLVFLDGVDVSTDIRSEEVSRKTRHAAASPKVRTVLVKLQRKIGRQLGSFVTEGRDQGSVVFPDADFKFYLDAAPAERARRRMLELQARGENADYNQILAGITARDKSDMSRSEGPLCIPENALIIDSTGKSIDDIQNEMLDIIKNVK